MPSNFDLIITADYPSRTAELRLLDGHGSQLAFRRTDFTTIAVSRQQGLFDLRNYVRNYVESGREAASVAAIGVCIAEEVLGGEIFRKLWESESQRTLRIQLPGATPDENYLAAALARVPWELARAAADQPTLSERNLLVRVVHDTAAPATQPLHLGKDESLRVLFVFAEARGSRPLAARLERQRLLRLFEAEIYPQRRIIAHFLTHGVTRERLKAQIQENGGYHIVHWSGHGHLNLLELAKPGGAKDHLSGDELLDLFSRAGGFIPRLFFLSACHSGDILRVQDWNDFLAVAQGTEPGTKHASASETQRIPLDEQPGYTGTAHALLQRGVPSVVAMRYAVGDDYARDLGVEFYRALLAHAQPKAIAVALTMARQSLLDPKKPVHARYDVCDHATPVLYGEEQFGLPLPSGRSPGLNTRNPRLHPIAELTMAEHPHFVGRTWELAGLGTDFIGASTGAEVKPVALITGLGGMGKTALAAEALALWESRFEWVLLYQAKPTALGFEATLRDIHLKLYAELGRYHEHVKSHPADKIYRAPDAEFTGAARLERLTCNLVRALRDEPILLALDNFETNLKPEAEPGTAAEPLWVCQDPAWDRCLTQLAAALVGTPSRLLITCRRPLAALAGTACHRVPLGPLPPGEAALYLREHAGLRHMIFSGDAAERDLAMRLLQASRFHPLLMDRLARLATGGPALRPQLLQALDTLEQHHDYTQLPALFSAGPADAKELAYLNDALVTSHDQLIRHAGPDARRLLWMIAVANDPVALRLLQSVWSAVPARPDPTPLLRYLVVVGLVTEERTEPDDANPDLTCHKLVRERIHVWMRDHPQDQADLTENAIRLAYAERLEAVFDALQHQNMTAALQIGSRALVYCVQAGAYDRLGNFASSLVTSTSDPCLLERLLPHLEAAVESAPEGESRWRCLCYLADALAQAGRADASLPFFEQAATLARTAAEAGGKNERRVWADFAWITGNWASALLSVGDLDASRQRLLDSGEADKKAERPAVNVIVCELGALRIDIMEGQAAQVLPQVEARLAQVEAWWQQHRAGQPVPEAPDPEMLARALISALDIAKDAHRAQEDWQSALRRTDAILEIKRALRRPAEDIASTRMNRAVALRRLGRFGEAQDELEACLPVFQNNPTQRARTLSSLAALFDVRGDLGQAITQQRRALALCEQLPDPGARAISHNNLANFLERVSAPAALAESSRHQRAALIYLLVSGLGQDFRTSLHNYAIRFRHAQAAGTPLAVPRVAELLADPAFRPLDDWLRQRQADVAEVQAAVDQALERARQAALDQPAAGPRVSAPDAFTLERSSPAPGADGVVYPVWFGTNRKPAAQGDGFTGERYDRITRGRVEVYVPEAHRFGETGTGFWRRLLRFDLRDDRLRLQQVEPQDREAFFADIHQAMQAARDSGEQPHALFFLHGFNVTFADAAVRAAQIGYDLKVPGATAFFSWPSRGSVAAYPVDEASIEASERAITDFLVDFSANCGAEKVHVIAHSMGNRGLLRALQRIAANAATQGKVKFSQIFLAAPDVDRDLFLDLARLYPDHSERTTLYASDGDLSVYLSSKLHDAPRAGYYTPYTVAPDIDTVAVSDFDIDLLGHAYFAQAEALLHDIHDLMRHNEAPAQRQRITSAVHEDTVFWRLRR